MMHLVHVASWARSLVKRLHALLKLQAEAVAHPFRLALFLPPSTLALLVKA
jgi:hypothetical protein